jgi:anti-sigma factor RsiW
MKQTQLSTVLSNGKNTAVSEWDEAIKKARERLAAMKRSIRGLEEMRDSGVPFQVSEQAAERSSKKQVSSHKADHYLAFGVRRPVGALVAGDLSPAVSRQVARNQSGDRSPQSKNAAAWCY